MQYSYCALTQNSYSRQTALLFIHEKNKHIACVQELLVLAPEMSNMILAGLVIWDCNAQRSSEVRLISINILTIVSLDVSWGEFTVEIHVVFNGFIFYQQVYKNGRISNSNITNVL